MSFWEKNPNEVPSPYQVQQAHDVQQYAFPNRNQPVVLDEQAVNEMQEEQFSVFEDEEEDTAEIMSDANLRLEQGRLYQMILRHDLFGETDADPKAIKNVQREIRKFVRERMETMLGIRQETPQETIVSFPFNDMEVTVLKMLAYKMSKGATESSTSQQQSEPLSPPPAPKKDGITSINGNLRSKEIAPVQINKPSLDKKVPSKPTNPKQSQKPVGKLKSEESALKKPIEQMTAEELAAHDAAALERRSKNYAQMPLNMAPHPSPQALEMMYSQSASNMSIANPWRMGQPQ